MNTQHHKLFIIDDNPRLVDELRQYLEQAFGESLTIFTFHSGESALKHVDHETNIVILDHDLPGENGNEILKSIKRLNPNAEVIMLTSNEDVKTAIHAFRNGASDYVIKGEKAEKKVGSLVYNMLTYPVRVINREIGASKFFTIFLLVFIFIGLSVAISLIWAMLN
ncbi:MAG TPA: response regulator [Fluviicola sp.]|nr:response regulator [Fluviicola sp.]